MQRLEVHRSILHVSFPGRLHNWSRSRSSVDEEVVDPLQGQATCFREEEVNDRDKGILDEGVSTTFHFRHKVLERPHTAIAMKMR